MDIGIIDADLIDGGTRHPNIALEKLSGFYKNEGHTVTLLRNYDDTNSYDKVFVSKVFNFTKTPDDLLSRKNVIIGGTGFFEDGGCTLPDKIEHYKPDYTLYDHFIEDEIQRGIKPSYFADYKNYSIGFATRGCFRKCTFCVNKKYDKAIRHATVKEFYDPSRKYIYLWDDNILAYSNWRDVFEELAEINKPFQFRQGMDIRLMTEEKAQVISQSKYKGDFIFAFDHMKDKDLIVKNIKLWKKHYTKKGNTKLYILCAYEGIDVDDIVSTLERIRILMELGCVPYIMRYENYENSKWRGIYITLARWANQLTFFKKQSLLEYVYKTDGIGREHKMYASKRYIEEFTKEHPDIAKKYFNLKFSDFQT